MPTVAFGTSIRLERLAAAGFELKLDASAKLPVGAVYEAPCSVKTTLSGILRVGAFSYINGAGRFSEVSIGRYCSIAEQVAVGYPEHPTDWMSSSSLQYMRPGWASVVGTWKTVPHQPVRHTVIGDDVWIGAGAFLRSGIEVGTGAIVGARAVVTKNIEPYMIVAGNPARAIRRRIPEHLVDRALRSQWWHYSPPALDGCPFHDVERAVEFVDELRARGAERYLPVRLHVTAAGPTLEERTAPEPDLQAPEPDHPEGHWFGGLPARRFGGP